MLVNTCSGTRVLLRAEHVIGRNPMRCDTCLSHPAVSTIHAVLRFHDGLWSVADHSRNGTFLDGECLERSSWTPLQLGQKLCFGTPELGPWTVSDATAPVTSLLPVDPELAPIPLGRNTLLPAPQVPEVAIYQASNGQWLLDGECGSRELRDGDRIGLAGRSYTLVVSCAMDETSAPLLGARLRLAFRVSRDEEHVGLTAEQWPKRVDLGERSHHYCLLTLARRRAADAKAGLDQETQGWIGTTELARQLRIEPQHLNIQVFRARNQLMSNIPGARELADIVERRRGFLRLGSFPFEIQRAGTLEADYAPVSAAALAPRGARPQL